MELNDRARKMLRRIASDCPERGDGKELLDLIESKRVIALEKSITPDPTQCRLLQGESIGMANLLKEFEKALK